MKVLIFFFYRRFDVVGFIMMRNFLMEVWVKKDIDEKELKKDLMKINFKFLKICCLDILKRWMIKRYICVDVINFNDGEKNKIVLIFSNEFIYYN